MPTARLDTPTVSGNRRSRIRRAGRAVLAPAFAVAALVGLWQALWAAAFWPEHRLPAPLAVWRELMGTIESGQVWELLWVSLHRAAIGFGIAVLLGAPLGLLLAKAPLVRAAIGPLVTGLQSLPSVAWVPAALLWFGLTDGAIYLVVLLGSVPSIANGLLAGIDQTPPILPRVGKVLGASRLGTVWHILLPAALPGFLAGLRQGWAFSWRSLMAAELIATSSGLGFGLGQYLQLGRSLSSMEMVFAGIFLIFGVGVGVELLTFRPVERAVLRARGLGPTH